MLRGKMTSLKDKQAEQDRKYEQELLEQKKAVELAKAKELEEKKELDKKLKELEEVPVKSKGRRKRKDKSKK